MKTTRLSIAVLGIMAALPAAAHHSFDMFFEREKTVRLTGTVSEYSFGNPHVYFTLSVPGRDGAPSEWHVETTNPNTLGPKGWGPDSIRPGQELAVEGWPARTGRPYLRLRSMTHAYSSPVGLWLPPGPQMNSET